MKITNYATWFPAVPYIYIRPGEMKKEKPRKVEPIEKSDNLKDSTKRNLKSIDIWV